MGVVERLLVTSEKLYSHLTSIPRDGKEREAFIAQIDDLLDERQSVLEELKLIDEETLRNHTLADHLVELDQGIQERLAKVMAAVKADMRELNQVKKSEEKYTNPYAATRTFDGMYYDRKN